MTDRRECTISVVVAVKLPAPYLSEAIDSLISQTRPADEIVLVAHGCADEHRTAMSPYESVVRIVDAERSLTLSEVRSLGLSEAVGELVAVLDSDDIAKPSRLEMQYDALHEAPQAVLCASEIEFIDEAGVVRGRGFQRPTNQDVRDALILRNRIAHSSVMYRRQQAIDVGSYRDLPLAEDYDLWLRLAAVGRFVFHEELLTQYRVHGGQLTSGRAVPRAAWRLLGESRKLLGSALGRNVIFTALQHLLWCAYQLRRWKRMMS